ncbi:MAG TPA: PIG-L deacetylase family protein [Planctomycetota bacterium]|nr:PIG-L deacetylase family protein [Planctomycetota bacterium]
MKILVVAAHPDDEVLGAGASVARWVDEGHAVQIAILGEGASSRGPARDATDASVLRELGRRAEEACKILGAPSPRMLGLADNRFDTLPLLEIVQHVEGLVAEFKPELVLTHHGGDLNIDHALTFRAVMTALRPMAGSTVRELRVFEIASSTEWSFGRFGSGFRPDAFVDVRRTLQRKLDAMACYDSETRPFPHPRSPEALEALARTRGVQVGMQAAEAFETIWRRE